ncbi:hypothetical protein [Tenacibaculum sp. 190524A02b]|uniref:hypothetical protein n=1 Tax=Tenacibaculum vairaonense TaxID=3137860 RepID=UPI0031FAC581
MSNKEKEKQLDDEIKNHSDTNKSLTFKVPEYLERKNVAYYSIITDLETCRNALLELQKENSEIVRTSLFTTVIILYGKCFTDSSSTNSPKLEPNCLESLEDLKILHQNLMSMRHNFVAHRGKTEHEFGKAYFQIFPKTMKWGIKVGLQRRFSFESEEISEYIKLIQYLTKISIEKYEKVGSKIMEHIITNFDNPNSENKMELINDVDAELKDYVMNLKIKKVE